MKKKKPIRKNKSRPAGNWDKTQKERQRARREKLDKIAVAFGYKSWSAYETNLISVMIDENGNVKPLENIK